MQGAILGDRPGQGGEDFINVANAPVFEGYWIGALSGEALTGKKSQSVQDGEFYIDHLIATAENDMNWRFAA